MAAIKLRPLFLIFAAVVLHISAICAHPAPVISERPVLLPTEVHAVIGENVTLNCSQPLSLKNTLIWSRNGTVMSIGRKKLTKNSARLRIRDGRNLQILNALPEDRGSYRCHYPSSSDNVTVAAYNFIVEVPRAADWEATTEPVMVINTVPAVVTEAPEMITWKLPGSTKDMTFPMDEVVQTKHLQQFPDGKQQHDRDLHDKQVASELELHKRELESIVLADRGLQEEATTSYLTPSRQEEASTFRITSGLTSSSRSFPLQSDKTVKNGVTTNQSAASTVSGAVWSTHPPVPFIEVSLQAVTAESKTGTPLGWSSAFGDSEDGELQETEDRLILENEEDDDWMDEKSTRSTGIHSLVVGTTVALPKDSHTAEPDDENPDDEISTWIPEEDREFHYKDEIKDEESQGSASLDDVNSTDAMVHLESKHLFPQIPAGLGPFSGTEQGIQRRERNFTSPGTYSWLNNGGTPNSSAKTATEAVTEAGISPETGTFRNRRERIFLGNATFNKWYDNVYNLMLDLEGTTVARTEAPVMLKTTSPVTQKSLSANVTTSGPRLKTTVLVDISDGEVLVDDGNVSIAVVMLKNDTAVKVNVNNETKLTIRKAHPGNMPQTAQSL